MRLVAITGIVWSLVQVSNTPIACRGTTGPPPCTSPVSIPPSDGAPDVVDSGTGHATYYSPEVGRLVRRAEAALRPYRRRATVTHAACGQIRT